MAVLWPGRGGDLGPCCAGRPLSVVRTGGVPGALFVGTKHNDFVVVATFHLVKGLGAVGGALLAGGRGICRLWVRGVVVGGWGLAFDRCGDPDCGQVLRRMIRAGL